MPGLVNGGIRDCWNSKLPYALGRYSAKEERWDWSGEKGSLGDLRLVGLSIHVIFPTAGADSVHNAKTFGLISRIPVQQKQPSPHSERSKRRAEVVLDFGQLTSASTGLDRNCMFSIGFTNEPVEYPYDDMSIPAAPGRLLLGKSIEEFLGNLALWSKSDYESHWIHELKALVEGRSKVALVVSYNDPKASSNLEIWRVYRDGEWAYFQNQLPWYSDLPHDFEISKMSEYIQDRVVISAEGNWYSEWDVAIRDIESFLRSSTAL